MYYLQGLAFIISILLAQLFAIILLAKIVIAHQEGTGQHDTILELWLHGFPFTILILLQLLKVKLLVDYSI